MYRLRLLLLVLLLPFLPVSALAKSDYFSYFNTDAFWQKLVLDTSGTMPGLTAGDTVILVATNRATGSDALRFMGEDRGNGSVRYFIVYTRGDKWHVHQVPSLRIAMQALPDRNKDWVVYTEGMGKIFTTDLDRGIGLATQYGVNVLLLDYPSIHSGYKSYRNFRFVMRNSSIAYRDFSPVIDSMRMLRREGLAGAGALSMFFHSMGNNVIRRIAQSSAYLHHFNDTIWVDNIILNAPCVPRRGSHRWIDSIRFAKSKIVHYNPYDMTLKWARIAGFRGVLGERPRKPLAATATYINFNPLCGAGHSNFLHLRNRGAAPGFAVAHYSRLFHGKSVPDTSLYRKSAYRNIGLDILPAAQL